MNQHHVLLVEAMSTCSSVQCDATQVVMGSEEESAVRYASI